MARVGKLSQGRLERMSLHEAVDTEYYCYELDGRKLLQINTFGRSSREMPGKVSQSLQFDETSAAELASILAMHFGSKR